MDVGELDDNYCVMNDWKQGAWRSPDGKPPEYRNEGITCTLCNKHFNQRNFETHCGSNKHISNLRWKQEDVEKQNRPQIRVEVQPPPGIYNPTMRPPPRPPPRPRSPRMPRNTASVRSSRSRSQESRASGVSRISASYLAVSKTATKPPDTLAHRFTPAQELSIPGLAPGIHQAPALFAPMHPVPVFPPSMPPTPMTPGIPSEPLITPTEITSNVQGIADPRDMIMQLLQDADCIVIQRRPPAPVNPAPNMPVIHFAPSFSPGILANPGMMGNLGMMGNPGIMGNPGMMSSFGSTQGLPLMNMGVHTSPFMTQGQSMFPAQFPMQPFPQNFYPGWR